VTKTGDLTTITFRLRNLNLHLLANIVENAVKFSVINSRVSIKLQRSANNIVLTCRNPIDKPVPDVENLTEEFRKSDALTPGIGMGLWICSRILEMHHASIKLSSTRGFFNAEITFPDPEVSSFISQG
jgi:two-component system sensor histidine kinase QseC